MMTDSEIIEGIKNDFRIEEFVDKRTFKKYGQKAWMFLDIRLLHTILIIRDELDLPMTINNWLWNGQFSQRGLRTNVCNIVKGKTNRDSLYLSAHTMGKAVDFDVKGMEAEEVRDWIIENQKLLPYKIRLEHNMNGKPVNWCHLDVYHLEKNPKVTLFNV